VGARLRANAVRDQGRSHGDRRPHGIRSARATRGHRCAALAPPTGTAADSARADAPAGRWHRLPGCPVAGSVLDPCLTCRPEPPRGKRMQRLPVGARLRANAFATKVAPTVTGAPAWASGALARAIRGHLCAALARRPGTAAVSARADAPTGRRRRLPGCPVARLP